MLNRREIGDLAPGTVFKTEYEGWTFIKTDQGGKDFFDEEYAVCLQIPEGILKELRSEASAEVYPNATLQLENIALKGSYSPPGTEPSN